MVGVTLGEEEVMNDVVFLCTEDNCILLWEQWSWRVPVSSSHVSQRQPIEMSAFGSHVSLLGQTQSSAGSNSQSEHKTGSGGLANEVRVWCLVPVDVWQLNRLFLITRTEAQRVYTCVCVFICVEVCGCKSGERQWDLELKKDSG